MEMQSLVWFRMIYGKGILEKVGEKRTEEVRSLTMAALPKGASGPGLSDSITSVASSLGS